MPESPLSSGRGKRRSTGTAGHGSLRPWEGCFSTGFRGNPYRQRGGKLYSFLAVLLGLPALQDGTVPLGAPYRVEAERPNWSGAFGRRLRTAPVVGRPSGHSFGRSGKTGGPSLRRGAGGKGPGRAGRRLQEKAIMERGTGGLSNTRQARRPVSCRNMLPDHVLLLQRPGESRGLLREDHGLRTGGRSGTCRIYRVRESAFWG